jgi:hypothetical protein
LSGLGPVLEEREVVGLGNGTRCVLGFVEIRAHETQVGVELP